MSSTLLGLLEEAAGGPLRARSREVPICRERVGGRRRGAGLGRFLCRFRLSF